MQTEIQHQILDFIAKFNYLFSSSLGENLSSSASLRLIERVMNDSGKQASEAILLLLYSIKYLQHDDRALEVLEENDNFQEFLGRHAESLYRLGVSKKVQYNLLERGLPVLEVLGRYFLGEKIAVIELGASYGLIGTCLCHHRILLSENDLFFDPTQQLPTSPQGVTAYLGIDLDPPGRDWILACTDCVREGMRIRRVIEDERLQSPLKIIKAGMKGFSRLEDVRKMESSGSRVVVLTSFVLYQLDKQMRDEIEREIFEFITPLSGVWIDQSVDTQRGINKEQYFICLNREKIISLPNDRCSTWRWISK